MTNCTKEKWPRKTNCTKETELIPSNVSSEGNVMPNLSDGQAISLLQVGRSQATGANVLVVRKSGEKAAS